MADEIGPNDIVQLLSGSQKMTVVRLENDAVEVCAVCGWISRGKSKIKTIPTRLLKKIAENE